MSLLASYNQSYKNAGHFFANQGLMKFLSDRLDTYSFRKKTIIEAGCGNGSLLPKIFEPDNTFIAFDFSDEAIRQAKEHDPQIDFHCEDTNYLKKHDSDVDLILDSHLIHCLMGKDMVESYLKDCFNALKPGGKMFVECMVFSKPFIKQFGLEEDGIYSVDKNVRTVIDYLDYEKMFLELGFKIEFFYIPGGRKFIFSSTREEVMPYDPDVLQVTLVKPEED